MNFVKIVILNTVFSSLVFATTFYDTIRIPSGSSLENISTYKNNSKYFSQFVEKEGEVVFIADSLDGVDAYYNAKTDGHGGGDYTFYQCTEYVGRYYYNMYKKYGIHIPYKQKINLKSKSNQGMIGNYLHSGMSFSYGGIPAIFVGKRVNFKLVHYPKNITKGNLYKKDSGFGHVAIVKNNVKIVYLKKLKTTYSYRNSFFKGYAKYYQVNVIEENKLPYTTCGSKKGCNIPKRAIFLKDSYSKNGYFSTLYTENISELKNGEAITLKSGSGIRFFKPPTVKELNVQAVDKMEFKKDITVIEDSKNNNFKNLTKFIKVWKIKNVGYREWTKEYYILSRSMNDTNKQLLQKSVLPNNEAYIGIEFLANNYFGEKQKYDFQLYDNNGKKVNNGYMNTTFLVQTQNCYDDTSGCLDKSYVKYEHLPYPLLTKSIVKQMILKSFNIDISGNYRFKQLKDDKKISRLDAATFIMHVAMKKNKQYVNDILYRSIFSEEDISFDKGPFDNIDTLLYLNIMKKNINKKEIKTLTDVQKFAIGANLFIPPQKNDSSYWYKPMRYKYFKQAINELKEKNEFRQ